MQSGRPQGCPQDRPHLPTAQRSSHLSGGVCRLLLAGHRQRVSPPRHTGGESEVKSPKSVVSRPRW